MTACAASNEEAPMRPNAGAPDLLLVARASDYAARKHAHDRRKGAAGEPYFNHLAEVALLVAEATAGQDGALVAAAYLHDTLEDTDATFEELTALFGRDIALTVQEVTNDPEVPGHEKKQWQARMIGSKSPAARRIKIADQTSNVLGIIHSPPVDWDEERRRTYVRGAALVVSAAAGTDAFLEARFAEAYGKAESILGPLGPRKETL
jgi:GTP diphosphokinase / guanosine-3',5'-bis(diphosphate) 3'-diphosphatase